jgi:hypothetical protein
MSLTKNVYCSQAPLSGAKLGQYTENHAGPFKNPPNKCQRIENIGGRTRARTWDPLIKSQLLYQLSYAPGLLQRRRRQARVA